MIERSLMNLGNTYRIRKAIEKARAGKEVTLAYIGGSITQGAGATPINTACYAYKSYQLFKSRNMGRFQVAKSVGLTLHVLCSHNQIFCS